MHFGIKFQIQKSKNNLCLVFEYQFAIFQSTEKLGKLNKFSTFLPHHPFNNMLQH
jgi:hypothetical protein